MDDIMERLRATSTAPLIHCGEESTDPCCWFCGEYDCHPADCHFRTGKSVTHEPCPCAKCTRDPKGYYCSCTCHHDWPSPLMLEAADEIERLRAEVNSMSNAQAGWGRVARLQAEIELLRMARVHLRSLLDQFVNLCTEEQHSVEMLCLHRAAMKPDVWERAQEVDHG